MLGRQTPRMAGTRPAATPCPEVDPSTHLYPDPIIPHDRSPRHAASAPSPACGALNLAAIYARVSSEAQEKDQTIASQLAALRQAAQARGYQVPPEWEFVDDGYSGARLDRPGLERLRDLAAEGTFAAVLVSAPDRLARNYAYQVVVLDELTRTGCEVIFLNHAFGQNPEEQMLLQIQGVFAEYERALITERTRRGRLYAARQGRVNWGGNPPYGYRYLRKTERTPPPLLVEEREAIVVQQIYRWLVEEQLSSYAMQKRLTAQHVPTRGTNAQGWAQSSVIRILSNPIYTGEAWYNRSQVADARRPRMQTSLKDLRPGHRRSRTPRPSTEWIPVRVPAVVDTDLWQMAQEQLAANRTRATRNNTKHQYLLRGLLVCGHCGRRLVGLWTAISKGRYVCSARYPRSAPWSCDGRSVSAVLVEQQVWAYRQEVLADPALLRARYEDSRGEPAVEGREERERQRLERQVHTMEHEVQRLIDAYQVGALDLAELQERRRRSAEHQQVLRQRLGELQQQQRERAQELRLLQGLEGFCASIRSALTEPSFAVKQNVLQLVVDRIFVEDTKLVIRHVVPTGPVRLQPRHHVANTPGWA
jgi:site-specific DNA recombinase